MEQTLYNSIDNLKKNGFQVRYFENISEMKSKLLSSIDTMSSIGIGGSQSIATLGIYDDLKLRGNCVYWHWVCDKNEISETLWNASQADIYLSSSNGITEDGKIINIDGTGNRVSSLLFGHKEIFIIVGKNKISKNISESIKRIKNVACPKNAERLNLQTPCRFNGHCTDCNSPDRMCTMTAVIEKNNKKMNINIFIVNENLGF